MRRRLVAARPISFVGFSSICDQTRSTVHSQLSVEGFHFDVTLLPQGLPKQFHFAWIAL
jgi:hypothetical protein